MDSMRFIGSTRLLALIGIFSFCAFAGDIVADSIADLCDTHCTSENSQSDSQHEKTPCSHCSCAVHNGAVTTSNYAISVSGVSLSSLLFPISEQTAPPELPVTIDHPPQLG